MERLTINELIAMLGGLLLGAGVFVKWYESVSPLAVLAGQTGRGVYSGWDAHMILRWVLLVMAVAPFILAYIIARDHQLTWARGELTAVLAIAAFGLLLYVGIVDRPGEPSGPDRARVGLVRRARRQRPHARRRGAAHGGERAAPQAARDDLIALVTVRRMRGIW